MRGSLPRFRMAHAGFVAYVVCCIGSDVSSNLRELHHELLSMMPMLRQAVDQQQQQQQSPLSHHEDINIAEPAENIAGMDRDDVLHWLMHCAGGGLDRFSVHAYEQNLDGRALMTWTDARFAAAGIGAADFSYTGEEGSAAREAAAHSRSTDSVYGLRAAIAVLRGSPALTPPAPPQASKLTSSSMRLELGLLLNPSSTTTCTAAADGRVQWVVQYCRAADQGNSSAAAAAEAGRIIPSQWPQVCEVGSPMRPMAKGGAPQPLEPIEDREHGDEWGAVWAHSGENHTWILNLKAKTNYAVRAVALHCGGARIAGEPLLLRTRERSVLKLLDMSRWCWFCNARPHVPVLVSASRTALLVRLAQHRYADSWGSYCRKVTWDFNLHLTNDGGYDDDQLVATRCNYDRPYCVFKKTHGIEPGRAYSLRHLERTEACFGIWNFLGWGCGWSDLAYYSTEPCANHTRGDGAAGCGRRGGRCLADGSCANTAVRMPTKARRFVNLENLEQPFYSIVLVLCAIPVVCALLVLMCILDVGPRHLKLHWYSSTRFLQTVKHDGHKVPLEGGKPNESMMQYEFGWCHAAEFRWSRLAKLLPLLDSVWERVTGEKLAIFNRKRQSCYSLGFRQALGEVYRGWGEETWLVRKSISSSGACSEVFLIEHIRTKLFGGRGKTPPRLRAAAVLEQRAIKFLTGTGGPANAPGMGGAAQPLDTEGSVLNRMVVDGGVQSRHLLRYHPLQMDQFVRFDAASDHKDVPEDFFIILDIAEFGDITSWYGHSPHPLPEVVCRRFFGGIIEGLHAMWRSERWLHCDIKPENVLLNRRGDTLLCDFGIARQVCACQPPRRTAATRSRRHGDWECSEHSQQKCGPDTVRNFTSGTVPYLAPERIAHHHCSNKSDIWAAGAILLELVTGHRVKQSTHDDKDPGLLGNIVEAHGAAEAVARHVKEAVEKHMPAVLPLDRAREAVCADTISDDELEAMALCEIDGVRYVREKDLMELLKQKNANFQPAWQLSSTLTELLAAMLEADPQKRIDLPGIFAHEWWKTAAATDLELARAMERQDPVRLRQMLSDLPEVRRAASKPEPKRSSPCPAVAAPAPAHYEAALRHAGRVVHPTAVVAAAAAAAAAATPSSSGASACAGPVAGKLGAGATDFMEELHKQVWENQQLVQFFSQLAAKHKHEKVWEKLLRPFYSALEDEKCTPSLFADWFGDVDTAKATLERLGKKFLEHTACRVGERGRTETNGYKEMMEKRTEREVAFVCDFVKQRGISGAGGAENSQGALFKALYARD
jgi:serine/threonine protein kinase